jgi:hypothetical protein
MRARLRRPSLLTKFSVLSLLVIAALDEEMRLHGFDELGVTRQGGRRPQRPRGPDARGLRAVRLPGSEQPVGAFEVYLPYAPVAAAIAEDARLLYLVLAGGLLALYATLLRIVAVASRRCATRRCTMR